MEMVQLDYCSFSIVPAVSSGTAAKPVTMQADQKLQNKLFKSQNQGLEGYLHKTNRPQQKKSIKTPLLKASLKPSQF